VPVFEGKRERERPQFGEGLPDTTCSAVFGLAHQQLVFLRIFIERFWHGDRQTGGREGEARVS